MQLFVDRVRVLEKADAKKSRAARELLNRRGRLWGGEGSGEGDLSEATVVSEAPENDVEERAAATEAAEQELCACTWSGARSRAPRSRTGGSCSCSGLASAAAARPLPWRKKRRRSRYRRRWSRRSRRRRPRDALEIESRRAWAGKLSRAFERAARLERETFRRGVSRRYQRTALTGAAVAGGSRTGAACDRLLSSARSPGASAPVRTTRVTLRPLQSASTEARHCEGRE